MKNECLIFVLNHIDLIESSEKTNIYGLSVYNALMDLEYETMLPYFFVKNLAIPHSRTHAYGWKLRMQ